MEQLTVELLNIEVSFLDKIILDIPRLSVHQFDRIGIVGKNGAGKSTLLKVIVGEVIPNKGKVNRLIEFGYFKQLSRSQENESDDELLSKLAIPQVEIEHLSGGEQTRMKLAQLFSTYYEGICIDEPTTHLDCAGIEFLIDQLRYYYGSLIIVSHDRTLLDELVTKIWEIDDGKVTEYMGNYSDYVKQRQLARKHQQEEHEKYKKEKKRLLQAAEEKMKKAKKVTQPNKKLSKRDVKAKANRMFMTKSKDTSQKSIERAAKAIEKRVEQLQEVEAPKENRTLYFHQSEALEMHNKFPIMADQLTLKQGEKILLQNTNFQFPLGKTIAITGKNGSGKTSLLKHIVNSGEGVTLSPKVVFGVYQQMEYQFDKLESVITYIKDRSDYYESKIRAVLHAMNFSGNDLCKDVRDLSGGEAVRLILCQLFLGRYNVLVLDEPTNFLDIDSIEALERFLKAYEGTVLFVSHDQMFVERVANHVYVIESQQLILK